MNNFDVLSTTPASHKEIQVHPFKNWETVPLHPSLLEVVIDELAILAMVIMENGGDPLVVTDSFIQVVGTLKNRFAIT